MIKINIQHKVFQTRCNKVHYEHVIHIHFGSVRVIQSLQHEGDAIFHGEESTRSFLACLREVSARESTDLQHGRLQVIHLDGSPHLTSYMAEPLPISPAHHH